MVRSKSVALCLGFYSTQVWLTHGFLGAQPEIQSHMQPVKSLTLSPGMTYMNNHYFLRRLANSSCAWFHQKSKFCHQVACKNSRFSSLFATGDVLHRGMSTSQQQKFHTDDVNQHLHNNSGRHKVTNANLFNFTFLLVDFGKVLCLSANKLQQNPILLLEKTIFHKYWLFY